MIVDLFAGGGGASVGIEAALGTPVSIAINHDPTAIAVHTANHPRTLHLTSDIWEVDPLHATAGRAVELLWASPDCRHFSRAKGDVPRSPRVRSLAWVVVQWAKAVRPQVILLENVAEFRTWGPLGPDGRPDRARAGQTFDEWVHALRRLGYEVEDRVLDASHYGAPTRRKRLFVVARRDGQSIRWPEPTHGPGRLPVRTAAECIDWSIPCRSIFDRPRPLAPATLRRVAEGIRRYVLGAAEPFVVVCNHGRDAWRGQGLDEPMGTVTAAHDARGLVAPLLAKAHSHGWDRSGGPCAPPNMPLSTIVAKDATCLAVPILATLRGTSDGHLSASSGPVDEPARVVSAGGSHHALVAPTLVQAGYGEREGQSPRVLDLSEPVGTVVAGGNKHALVSAFLARHFGGMVGEDLRRPIPTVTAVDHHSLVAATVAKFYGTADAQPVNEPLHTATTRARFALVTAFLEAHGIKGPHVVRVGGVEYAIADIGLRMLEPHELLRAQFGDHAEEYDLSAARSKAAKIRLIGNSVCPDVAAALVRANVAAEVLS